MLKLFPVLVALTFAVGCASTQTYEVAVHNQTAKPVTLWLTKSGGQIEEGWVSPEQLLASSRGDELSYDKADVPPGKTGYVDKISGHFPTGVFAVLRVYRGSLTLDDILRDIKNELPRTNYQLTPGKNDLAVTDEHGQLIVSPTSSPTGNPEMSREMSK